MKSAQKTSSRPLRLMRWSELERAALDAGLTLAAIRKARNLADLRLAVERQREAT